VRESVYVCVCMLSLSLAHSLSRALSLSRARTPSQVTLHRSLESEYAQKRREAVWLKQEWAQQVCYMSICIYLFFYTSTYLYTNACTHMHACMHACSLPLSPSRSLSLQRQLLLLQIQVEHKTKAKSLARLPDVCVLDDKSMQERLAKLKA
jgi:hypothetical protein